MRTDQEMKWEVLKTEQLFSHPWLNVTREHVRLPNGTVYDDYYTLHYPTFANIIAITKEGKIILERQYRHAMGIVSTELVAGWKRVRHRLKGHNVSCWKKLDILAVNGRN